MLQQLFDSSRRVSDSTNKQLSSGWAGKITRQQGQTAPKGIQDVPKCSWHFEVNSVRVNFDWKHEWIWMKIECLFSFKCHRYSEFWQQIDQIKGSIRVLSISIMCFVIWSCCISLESRYEAGNSIDDGDWSRGGRQFICFACNFLRIYWEF